MAHAPVKHCDITGMAAPAQLCGEGRHTLESTLAKSLRLSCSTGSVLNTPALDSFRQKPKATTNNKETAVQQALSPYATAGVAIVGASLIAVTPVAAPLPDLSDLQSRAVQLSAFEGSDSVIEQFNTASDNFQQVAHNFGLAPGVALQQAIVNEADFLQRFFNDPSSLPDVVSDQQDNFKTALSGFTGLDMSGDTQDTVFDHTLEGLRPTLVDLLPGFLPGDIDPDQVTTILEFLSSPLSGILIGMAGPFVAPWVALFNSISDGDGFGETLANTVGAFFNGADLDLDSLAPQINDADILPEGMSVDHLDLALGGLFSTGEVDADDYGVPTEFGTDSTGDSSDTVYVDFDAVTPVGGSIFNSLGIDIVGVPLLGELDLESHPLGPLAALIGASQTVGVLLGDGWDEEISGKNAPDVTGPATPPLIELVKPMLPDDFFGDGGDDGGGGAEAVAPFSDILSGFSDVLSGDETLGDFFSGLF
jgi:hypothetical protein